MAHRPLIEIQGVPWRLFEKVLFEKLSRLDKLLILINYLILQNIVILGFVSMGIGNASNVYLALAIKICK